MASYGIRREFIPIDSDGNVDNTELLKLLETFQRKEAEEKEKTDEGVIKCPSANDVLLGRGKPYQEYLGNSRMNEMIDERREAYQAASKIQKTAFRDAVLKLIQDSNGRFLKKSDEDENLWVEVGENVARDKISHSFCRRL